MILMSLGKNHYLGLLRQFFIFAMIGASFSVLFFSVVADIPSYMQFDRFNSLILPTISCSFVSLKNMVNGLLFIWLLSVFKHSGSI